MSAESTLKEIDFLMSLSATVIARENRSDVAVLVHCPYDQDVVNSVVGDGFASVIFTRAPDVDGQESHDDRFLRVGDEVGWFDAYSMDFRLPRKSAKALFVCSQLVGLLGTRALRELLRRRVRSVYLISPIKFEVYPVSLTRLALSIIVRRLWLEGDKVWDGLASRVLTKLNTYLGPGLRADKLGVVTRPGASAGLSKQKVAIVCGSLGAGGAERQVVNTAIGLKKRGCDNIVVYTPFLGNLPKSDFYLDYLVQQEVDVKIPRFVSLARMPKENVGAFVQIASALSLYPDVYNLFLSLTSSFLEDRPDIVHGWLDMTNIAAGYAALVTGVPKILLSSRSVAPPNFSFEQPYMKVSYRHLLEYENVMMVNNSSAGASDYAAWLDIGEDEITVLRNGIDVSHFQRSSADEVADMRYRLALPDKRKVVATLIRFTEEKRPMLWAEIAAEMLAREPDCCFVMWGDGPLRSTVQKWVDENGYSDHIRLPGHEANVGLALSIADCFLLTSRKEGLPNVLLEAQLLGVPVVTANAGGASEAVHSGVLGWVVEGSDPKAYAERILQVLGEERSPVESQKIGAEFVEKRFGLDRMIDETIASYGACETERHN